MKVDKHLRLQKAFWVFAQIFVGPVIRLIMNYHCKVTRPKSRVFLALYNHTDDIDPFYMGIGLRSHMRYVASSVILEGFAGKLISLLLGPIPRIKAQSADETVERMLENLKAGISIALSAEGNRSWDGETMYISPRTAEVAKLSGAGLVTFRIHGGYLRTPRFAVNKCRGPVFGELVREYSAEELAAMSTEEIAACIAEDLYTNAYMDQKDPPQLIRTFMKDQKTMISYKGKAKAENIESILYICPECEGIGTLSSQGDEFHCSCGLKGKVNDYGFLEGALPYDNTVDWNHWQKAYLKEHAAEFASKEEPVFTDQGAEVHITKDNERELFAKNAEVLFYPDRVELREQDKTHCFMMDKISKFGAFRSKRIFFQTAEEYCELSFDHIVSGMKYEAFWRVLTGRTYY